MGFGNFDFSAIAKGQQAWNTFKQNHPQFPKFLKHITNKGLTEGTIITISVQYPDDPQKVNASIKLKPSDVEQFNAVKGNLDKFL